MKIQQGKRSCKAVYSLIYILLIKCGLFVKPRAAEDKMPSVSFQSKYIHFCKFTLLLGLLSVTIRCFIYSNVKYLSSLLCSPTVSGVLPAGSERWSEQTEQELRVGAGKPPVSAGSAVPSQPWLLRWGSIPSYKSLKSNSIPAPVSANPKGDSLHPVARSWWGEGVWPAQRHDYQTDSPSGGVKNLFHSLNLKDEQHCIQKQSDLEADGKLKFWFLKRKMEVYYLAQPALSLDSLICSAYSTHLC